MRAIIIFVGGIVMGAFIMEKYRNEILSMSDLLDTIESEVDDAIQVDNTGEQQPETASPTV
jgi:hypothetical protein